MKHSRYTHIKGAPVSGSGLFSDVTHESGTIDCPLCIIEITKKVSWCFWQRKNTKTIKILSNCHCQSCHNVPVDENRDDLCRWFQSSEIHQFTTLYLLRQSFLSIGLVCVSLVDDPHPLTRWQRSSLRRHNLPTFNCLFLPRGLPPLSFILSLGRVYSRDTEKSGQPSVTGGPNMATLVCYAWSHKEHELRPRGLSAKYRERETREKPLLPTRSRIATEEVTTAYRIHFREVQGVRPFGISWPVRLQPSREAGNSRSQTRSRQILGARGAIRFVRWRNACSTQIWCASFFSLSINCKPARPSRAF